jgi:hypothetical protein
MPNLTSSDQLVDPKAMLEAISELKRRGNDVIMKELELIEGELASFIFEVESLIYKTLVQNGVASKRLRKLIVQIESMALVCVLALRQAQLRLWQQEEDEQKVEPMPQAALDPSDIDGPL